MFLMSRNIFLTVRMEFHTKEASEDDLDEVCEEYAKRIGGSYLYKSTV